MTGAAVHAAGPNGYLVGRTPSGALLLWRNGALVDVNAPVSTAISPAAVNGQGEIVGWDGRSRTPFVYRDGIFQSLPFPAGGSAFASAINESGDIVGTFTSSSATPYRSVLWKRSRPGTYQLVADDVAIGIDDAGHVVTEKGLVWSPDGTTSQLEGSPVFQRGHALGRQLGDRHALRKWDVTGALVHRYELTDPAPSGINTQGQLAVRYTPGGGTERAVGVWRDASFVGDVPGAPVIRAVMETGELAGQQFSTTGTGSVPTTWTCA